ncbi:MAG TPA: hypothetical protein VGP69_17720 [Gaiellaceae bacterium]|nr:hypothetical protein [Gaiellaceae bacterium]
MPTLAMSSLDPTAAAALVAAAAFLMTQAGLGKRRLRRRTPSCPVCHRPGASCTCRWL